MYVCVCVWNKDVMGGKGTHLCQRPAGVVAVNPKVALGVLLAKGAAVGLGKGREKNGKTNVRVYDTCARQAAG